MAKHKLSAMGTVGFPRHCLPDEGKLVAFVVGIEHYRPNSKSPAVEFTRNDAEAIADALITIHGHDCSNVQLLLEDDATTGNTSH